MYSDYHEIDTTDPVLNLLESLGYLCAVIMGASSSETAAGGAFKIQYVGEDVCMWKARLELLLSVLQGPVFRSYYETVFIHNPSEDGQACIEFVGVCSTVPMRSDFKSKDDIISHVVGHIRAGAYLIRNTTMM